jgi:GTPase SAR1 family protein
MARNQNSTIKVTNARKGSLPDSSFVEISINRNILEDMKPGIKITMLGDEAAGKSTLIGVLISG